MKKLVVTLSALAAFTGSAVAADMAPRYSKAPPMPVAAVVNWTGCYVGGGGGYGMWNQENTGFNQDIGGPRVQISETATAGGRGYFGTVQGGCDYQFAGMGQQFVVGAFGDYDFSSLKGKLNLPNTIFFGDEKMSSAWSAGARLGWLVTPSFLTYFSAGYTEATFDRADFHFNLAVPQTSIIYFGNKTYKGYFIGAGDEYALGFMPGLFWKTEYRLSQFDTEINRTVNTQFNTLTGTTYESRKWVQTIRSELVYRFNWGGAVVAKY